MVLYSSVKTELAPLTWNKTFGIAQNWVDLTSSPFWAGVPQGGLRHLNPIFINRRGKNSSQILWLRIGEKTHGKNRWHSDLSIDNCSSPFSMPGEVGLSLGKGKGQIIYRTECALLPLQRKVLKDTVCDPDSRLGIQSTISSYSIGLLP